MSFVGARFEMKWLMIMMLSFTLLADVTDAAVVEPHQVNWENPVGMGVYNDTPGAPSIAAQLPVAANFTGPGGKVLLYANLVFRMNGNVSSLEPFPSWVGSALKQAYSLQLRPVLRLGQWPRTIRDFGDASSHTQYTNLARAYAEVVSQVPLPPASHPPLDVLVLNEPNVCGEWQCAGGCNVTLEASEAAREVASCLRDLKLELLKLKQTLNNRIEVGVAPVSQLGYKSCQCCQDPQPSPQNVTGITYINAMLSAVPNLYDGVDFFSSHCYPLGEGPYPGDPRATHGLQVYRGQAETAGISNSTRILITETGWSKVKNETEKAVYTRNAWKEIFLADTQVAGVFPFLLAGDYWEARDLPWTDWANDTLIGVKPEYVAIQALSHREAH